jgi:hypothetical protein
VSDTNPDEATPAQPAVPPVPPPPPAYGAHGDYPTSPSAPPASTPDGAVPTPYGSAPPYGGPPAYGSAPSYGATAYGSAPAYGAPYGAAKTNSLAIVSLVSSLVGLLIIPFVGSIVGVITGHMALGQIKQTGEQGRGLALAGTIMGYAGLLFVVLGVIAFLAFLPFLITSVNTSV